MDRESWFVSPEPRLAAGSGFEDLQSNIAAPNRGGSAKYLLQQLFRRGANLQGRSENQM